MTMVNHSLTLRWAAATDVCKSGRVRRVLLAQNRVIYEYNQLGILP